MGNHTTFLELVHTFRSMHCPSFFTIFLVTHFLTWCALVRSDAIFNMDLRIPITNGAGLTVPLRVLAFSHISFCQGLHPPALIPDATAPKA